MEILILVLLYYFSQNPDFSESVRPLMAKLKSSEQMLTFLKEYGIKIGVASSTKEALVRQQLLEGGLFDYFDVILGGDHVKNGKPDPEIYLKTCAALDVNPAETFAIEDSFNGIHSAHSAGINVIMVPDLVEASGDMSKLCVCVQPDHFHVLEYFKKEL